MASSCTAALLASTSMAGRGRNRGQSPRAPLLLLAIALCGLCGKLAAAQDTAGNTCQGVLRSGVSGTVVSTYGASVIQQAACLDYSTYNFSTYLSDTASGSPTGTAVPLNLAATTFGWGGASAAFGASTLKSEIQFNDAKLKAAAYKATACGFSFVSTPTDPSVTALAQFIDSAVYGAYVACLKLFASGLRITQSNGITPKTLNLDVRFVPVTGGPAKAYFMGLSIFPKYTAGCVVYRPDGSMSAAQVQSLLQAQWADPDAAPPPPPLTAGTMATAPKPPKTPPKPPAFDPFRFELVANQPYSVFCQINPNTAGSSTAFSDVTIYTTTGSAFHALLFNTSPSNATTTADVAKRLSSLEAKVATMDGRIAALDARMAVLEARAAAGRRMLQV